MSGVLDRTVGHIVAPDGSLLARPTILIGADAATIIRAYLFWAMSHQLEPELLCAHCFDHSRDSKADYHITETEIQIVCQCSIRFFRGASLTPDPIVESTTVTPESGPTLVAFSADVARLLRLYKKVLLALGLKQALRCNTCYGLDLPDGCEARTTDAQIRIRCRCTDRTYAGMTV